MGLVDRLTFTYDKRKEQPRTAALVDSLETSLSTLDSFLLVLVGPGLYLPFLVVVLMPTSRSDRCIHTRVLGSFTCRVKKRMDQVARAGLSLSLCWIENTHNTHAHAHILLLYHARFSSVPLTLSIHFTYSHCTTTQQTNPITSPFPRPPLPPPPPQPQEQPQQGSPAPAARARTTPPARAGGSCLGC